MIFVTESPVQLKQREIRRRLQTFLARIEHVRKEGVAALEQLEHGPDGKPLEPWEVYRNYELLDVVLSMIEEQMPGLSLVEPAPKAD